MTTKLAVALLVLAVALGCRGAAVSPPRVLILGFDGMDFAVARDLMAHGRMPHFSSLAAQGSFAPLATSVPPQSPVAWSTFTTGLDPGAHGIFDFIHRDPATMTPYLSTTRTTPAGRIVNLGRWRFPLSSASIESLRHGAPFWEALEKHGIRTTVMRMPANFPPSGSATRELSGMDTPDIVGTYGQFSLFTSDPQWPRLSDLGGGTVHGVSASSGVIQGVLSGPEQPFLTDRSAMQMPFAAHVDSTRRYVLIEIGGERRLLRPGEWSDWVPIRFDVAPAQSLPAMCRFFLQQIDPHFELYVSPLNLDPVSPALPISSPPAYAGELASATGRFSTLGMPEETKALKAGVFSVDEFLHQAREMQRENLTQFRYSLDHFENGLFFHYFGNLDQVSHMLWRARDPQHPAYDAVADAPYARVIDDLYVEFDAIVGEARQRLRPDDLLVVMSDHGFTSWRRAFNLNTWLRNEGYVVASVPGDPSLGQISLSRSRAYGLGLNGLYVNLENREQHGVVAPEQRDRLLAEITERLLQTKDPATGKAVVATVFRREQIYSPGANDAVAPDLIIGYAKGTRVSDESALGALAPAVLVDNTSAWSGDHCMTPDAVPGVLLTSRTLRQSATTLQELAGAIVAEMGVAFPHR